MCNVNAHMCSVTPVETACNPLSLKKAAVSCQSIWQIKPLASDFHEELLSANDLDLHAVDTHGLMYILATMFWHLNIYCLTGKVNSTIGAATT